MNTPSPRQMIPVYRPYLAGNEKQYVLDCVESSWISSIGKYIGRFEEALAGIIGVPQAVVVCNGTVALHLALHCLDIGPGDEVIVPTFTYIASVNTIAQTGAKPVFVDSRPGDWLLDAEQIETLITPRTKAIMAVHLYGAVCDMPAILEVARRHGLKVIEDCAESLGSTLGGRHTGTFGDVGTFSFFGNKTITTGEGGAVVANDQALSNLMRMVKGQGQSLTRRYWHEVLGFNYRMTNIAAAIGLAQTENLPDILARKKAISGRYRELLASLPVVFQEPQPGVSRNEWLVTILLPSGCDRDRLMADMQSLQVETRPVFFCAHHMPMYAEGSKGARTPVAENIASRGISLPSFPALTMADLDQVAEALSTAMARQGYD
jgi:perosamine synthetase